jgi:uncharacterized small protein (DUF1192 family)
MTIDPSGNLGINTGSPTQKLDVNGYARVRPINGEGGTILLDGQNGTNVWVENNNGVFRVVNSGWTAQIFGVDQFGTAVANAFVYASDRRLKKEIAPLSGNLDKVLALQPVTWLWKDQNKGTDSQIGFIAQDVQQVVPEIVHTDTATTLESIDYARLSPLLVGSVQELNKKIEVQQQAIETLQANNAVQQKQIDALTEEMHRLEKSL